ASVALYFYFTQLAGYSAYGAIGGVMALLFALWIFNIVLLMGLELDTEVERAKQLIAGMPAEEAVKLPPKDADALVKKAEAQEKLEEKGYELRASHNDGTSDRWSSDKDGSRDGGAHAADKA
ncbi:MAG: hypothetical protein Q4D18_06160, partial [Micrococcus sp.]|nr:hypothetical protein [Micrococcus sp.]